MFGSHVLEFGPTDFHRLCEWPDRKKTCHLFVRDVAIRSKVLCSLLRVWPMVFKPLV